MYTEFSTMALDKRNTPIKSTRLPCTTTCAQLPDDDACHGCAWARGGACRTRSRVTQSHRAVSGTGSGKRDGYRNTEKDDFQATLRNDGDGNGALCRRRVKILHRPRLQRDDRAPAGSRFSESHTTQRSPPDLEWIIEVLMLRRGIRITCDIYDGITFLLTIRFAVEDFDSTKN